MNLGEEAGMVQALRRRGFPVYVVPVKRTDWLKVSMYMAWSEPVMIFPSSCLIMERVKAAAHSAHR